jgi:hypothetical protein
MNIDTLKQHIYLTRCTIDSENESLTSYFKNNCATKIIKFCSRLKKVNNINTLISHVENKIKENQIQINALFLNKIIFNSGGQNSNIPRAVPVSYSCLSNYVSSSAGPPATAVLPSPPAIAVLPSPPTAKSSFVNGPSTESSFVNGPSTESSFVAGPSTESSFVALPSTETSFVALPSTESSFVALPSTNSSFISGPSTELATSVKTPEVVYFDLSLYETILSIYNSIDEYWTCCYEYNSIVSNINNIKALAATETANLNTESNDLRYNLSLYKKTKDYETLLSNTLTKL